MHNEKAGPAIILVEPQLGENIGMTARAMANFGLYDLRLVAPRDGWPSEAARAAAAGADMVINDARIYESTQSAVADLHLVLATTARQRDMVKPVLSPGRAIQRIYENHSNGRHGGILFGRERSGLDNDSIALADAIIMAPVDPEFASLNLAQAVLLIAYEWGVAGAGAADRPSQDASGSTVDTLVLKHTRPASRGELVGFFEHLESELDRSGFLRPQEKRPAMLRNIRNMFMRMGATEQDVRTLRGIVASLTRFHKNAK